MTDAMFQSLQDREKVYAFAAAAERDSRLNVEEKRVYHDTLIELEYGFDFFTRAHP